MAYDLRSGHDLASFRSYGSHIAVSVTSRCPLRCAHCISESGPEREGHVDLDANALETLLAEIESDRDLATPVEVITLTGGEAALRGDFVRRTVHAAKRRKIRVSLMTSGYWGRSREAAARFLDRLGGIDLVTFSTDLEHLRFVPLDWVRNAFDAAEEKGITSFVRLTRAADPNDAERKLEELLEGEFKERLEVQTFVPWGRGESYGPAQRAAAKAAPPVPTLPCPSDGQHILESGHVIPCCNTIVALPPNHSLVLGDLNRDSYRDVQEASARNPLLLFIRLFGFGPLLEALNDAGFDVPNEDVTPCHVCAVILRSPDTGGFAADWAASPRNILNICAALKPLVEESFDFAPIVAQARILAHVP